MLKPVNIADLKVNPFEMIGKEWFLVTGGNASNFNMMTAAWGALGFIWDKPMAFTAIRKSRYTYSFLEDSEYCTLSFFGKDRRDALKLCGAKSGRDIDKVKETGLTPKAADCGAVYFEEAELVLVCKKMYYDDFKMENLLAEEAKRFYPTEDYHRFYIGEIVQVLSR